MACGQVFTRPAAAHADLDPLHDHRVLSVHVTDRHVALTYVLALSATTSSELRRAADADGDGRLSAAETASLHERAQAFASGLSLRLDDEDIALSTAPLTVDGLDGPNAGTGLAAGEIAFRFSEDVMPKIGGQHVLRAADSSRLPRAGDLHVRVSGEGKVARVVSVDRRMEARLSFLEAAFHRQDTCQTTACEVAITFEGGGVRPPPLARWPFALAGAGSVVALAFGAWRWRRRRSPPLPG